MNRDYQKFLVPCNKCIANTNKKYAANHAGQCKACAEPEPFKDKGELSDTYHDYIVSGARAAGVSFSDC